MWHTPQPGTSLHFRGEHAILRELQVPQWKEAVGSNLAPAPLGHLQMLTAPLLRPEVPRHKLVIPVQLPWTVHLGGPAGWCNQQWKGPAPLYWWVVYLACPTSSTRESQATPTFWLMGTQPDSSSAVEHPAYANPSVRRVSHSPALSPPKGRDRPSHLLSSRVLSLPQPLCAKSDCRPCLFHRGETGRLPILANRTPDPIPPWQGSTQLPPIPQWAESATSHPTSSTGETQVLLPHQQRVHSLPQPPLWEEPLRSSLFCIRVLSLTQPLCEHSDQPALTPAPEEQHPARPTNYTRRAVPNLTLLTQQQSTWTTPPSWKGHSLDTGTCFPKPACLK